MSVQTRTLPETLRDRCGRGVVQGLWGRMDPHSSRVCLTDGGGCRGRRDEARCRQVRGSSTTEDHNGEHYDFTLHGHSFPGEKVLRMGCGGDTSLSGYGLGSDAFVVEGRGEDVTRSCLGQDKWGTLGFGCGDGTPGRSGNYSRPSKTPGCSVGVHVRVSGCVSERIRSVDGKLLLQVT